MALPIHEDQWACGRPVGVVNSSTLMIAQSGRKGWFENTQFASPACLKRQEFGKEYQLNK